MQQVVNCHVCMAGCANRPIEAEPAARLPVTHDGRSEVHQAATSVNHFVQVTLGFSTPLQYPGEPTHPNILPILQASHLGCVGAQLLQARNLRKGFLLLLFLFLVSLFSIP